ncbi:FeoB-associated Cys-rich membrane protein [Comamonadaceae bacterium M7527]|nr:FeoB-associated Cys-rich membrane protein [Comamonadaceae bacterium M7527]
MDWQEWVVGAMVMGAAAYLVRRWLRSRAGKAPACGNCDTCQCPTATNSD